MTEKETSDQGRPTGDPPKIEGNEDKPTPSIPGKKKVSKKKPKKNESNAKPPQAYVVLSGLAFDGTTGTAMVICDKKQLPTAIKIVQEAEDQEASVHRLGPKVEVTVDVQVKEVNNKEGK